MDAVLFLFGRGSFVCGGVFGCWFLGFFFGEGGGRKQCLRFSVGLLALNWKSSISLMP